MNFAVLAYTVLNRHQWRRLSGTFHHIAPKRIERMGWMPLWNQCKLALFSLKARSLTSPKFPIFSRASFGTRGVYLALLCRAIAAIFWFGTQTYQGGQCLQVMLQAIWPSFKHFPNHLPASASVTSAQLLCFFVSFCLLTLIGKRLMSVPCSFSISFNFLFYGSICRSSDTSSL